ncbi:PAS domain-containing sensor histidine kinase [Methanonatronarchaeum sp. AMET-Sl]|uniref:PAS domain-containing sensor histidine kinase n=1 Tax=Methanonatronarchaeum sp. AMET-Sl TaxID=3037654 RepID=UPI00244E4AA3|nr:PAS domain-containing sensor histidine kinase [Methanonatronarchaeum sp. AMET-Sl]WGI17750.1 PAS domain-containing sensor histidine kinase [Methanonatronarchaeum sp. AMET-Sl]
MSFSGMDRAELEEELKIYRGRLEKAMEIGDLAWWEMELPSGLVKFNSRKSEMIGYPEDRFEHYSDFTELIHPDDYEKAMQAMRDHIEGRADRYEVEYRIEKRGGGYKWFRDVGGITEKSGEYQKITGVVIDITERKESQEREELLDSLLRHDIRNKIQVIQGYLDLLSEQELPKKADKYIDKSRNNIEESIDIIKKASKLREAKNEELMEIDIDSIVKEVVKQTQPMAEEKEIEIKIDTELKGEEALAGQLINQVFTNIIENAIQHSNATKIHIKREITRDKLIYSIEDNGKGIPKEKHDKVFKRAYTTDKNRGTGLGLFLVKTILSIYGSEIKLDKSKHGGAKFDVILQRAKQTPN